MSPPSLPPPAAGGRLTIDLAAFAANWRDLSARARGAEVAAVVKGDAYGIGIEAAVPALLAAGCRRFFTALPEEGLRVRALAPDAPVTVLGSFVAGQGALYARARLRPVLGSLAEVDDWLAETRGEVEGAVLHVDTGMNRLGMSFAEAAALAASPALARLGPSLVMSHLAVADTPAHPLNALQLERFSAVRALFPGVPASLANSAGLLGHAATHADVARPGIALYGGRSLAGADPMRPVVTLEARVLQLREVVVGEGIGYGAAFVATRPSRIAVAGVGYADGYHRMAGDGGAEAAVAGRRVPLAGRVSMDLVAVDVTDLPPGAVRRGDWIELLGATIPVDEVAARSGTIGYELLTGLGRRLERRYVGGTDG